MSKFEGDIVAAGPGPVELDELLAGPGRRAPIAAERHDALARYLSGGEEYRDELAALDGLMQIGSKAQSDQLDGVERIRAQYEELEVAAYKAFAATAPPRPRLTAGEDR